MYVVQKAVYLILSYPHKNIALNNQFIYCLSQWLKTKHSKNSNNVFVLFKYLNTQLVIKKM